MKMLIVGGGLAGIAMARRFSEKGVDFLVIANKSQESSTAIATGMFNPVVFRRLKLSWMVNDLLPEMRTFYKGLEVKLGVKLIADIDYFRRIPGEDYRSLWNKRLTEPEYPDFMQTIAEGYGEVKQAGIVNCKLLREAYLDSLEQAGQLLDDTFDYSALRFVEGEPMYKGDVYQALVFCEGPYAINNPYFNWLPFKLCQGEWLIIKTDKVLTERVINNRTNIIPLGNMQYKLSSSYSWEQLDWQPSEAAREGLIKDFMEVFDVDFEVLEQRAALRPTVADRRPYLGAHPEHQNIYIFNGLGSKGVMLAPYFSKHLAMHILEKRALMPEVDISRHIKRYVAAKEG